MSGFSIPLSGLEAMSSSLNVIANNLANLNTDGFKDESLSFSSIFNQVQQTAGNGRPDPDGFGSARGWDCRELDEWDTDDDGRSFEYGTAGERIFCAAGQWWPDELHARGRLYSEFGRAAVRSEWGAGDGVSGGAWGGIDERSAGADLGEPVDDDAGSGDDELWDGDEPGFERGGGRDAELADYGV